MVLRRRKSSPWLATLTSPLTKLKRYQNRKMYFIKILSAPCLNAFPAKSWKSKYWRTFTDCWLVFAQEKDFPEGSGVVDLLDHLARLWLIRLESQGIFTWLHQNKLNKGTDQNLVCPLSQCFSSRKLKIEILENIHWLLTCLCAGERLPQKAVVLWTLLTIWLAFDWWDRNHKVCSLNFIKISSKREQIKIWSAPHPNVFLKKLKNLILELIHWLLTWFIAGERCALWQVAMFLLTSLTCFAFVNTGKGNRNLFEMPSYEIRYARYVHLK